MDGDDVMEVFTGTLLAMMVFAFGVMPMAYRMRRRRRRRGGMGRMRCF